ncbi:RagB/SusD family nutrient uptake outer membrane protein [Mariniphaga sediminis]|uniref:RagB/SusD family nutrient uptake outer membrane protein n=1 Tax=Mariniphaga sediminis TaxID=1628158 RepID=UPI003561A0C5
MKNYIIGIIFLAGTLFMWSCGDQLDLDPANATTDEEILELLASGDAETIDLIMSGMANGMPLAFNGSGKSGAGTADDRYRSIQGLNYMRNLEANDIVFGDQVLGSFGASEYQFEDFISQSVDRNVYYWKHMWSIITDANKMLFYLTDETVGDNVTLKKYKAWGLVARAYAYAYLMETYQDSYLQGGNTKLGLMIYDTYDPNQEYKARSSSTATYAFIENDLETAINLLEAYFTSEDISGYTEDLQDIDLGVAKFLLARIKLITGEWDEVVSLCNDILSAYPDLIAEEYYGGANKGLDIRPETNAFLFNDVNPEAILGFPSGLSLTHHNGWTNPFGEGSGGLGGGYSRIDDQLFVLIDDNDYRQDCFLDTMIVDYTYPTNGVQDNVPVYTNLKFAATYGVGSDDPVQVGAVDCYYMRSSEVLLMKAEAQAQGGSDSGAKETLNTLLAARTRDGATTLTCDNYSSMAGMSALQMVQLQWRIEMWGEGGLEYLNNKRWGVSVDRTNSGIHTKKVTYDVAKMTCDIPDAEMLYNPLCEQN